MATQAEHTDAFVAQYNGQYIDEDRYYGSQCWDLVARYAREKYGCPSFPTGSGGAEGLFRIFAAPIPNFFNKVGVYDLQKGDIAVWGSGFFPPFGHTALVVRRDADGIYVLEQNGAKDSNGDGNADGVSYLIKRSFSGVSGGLRPKETNMSTLVTKEYARMLHSEMEGWDLNKTHAGEYDALFMAAWGGRPIEELLWQKWNNNGGFRGARERNRIFYATYASIVDGLSARPTKEELQKALDQIGVEAAKAQKAEAAAAEDRLKAQAAINEAAKLRDEKEKAVDTGNLFTRWIGDLINKLAGVK